MGILIEKNLHKLQHFTAATTSAAAARLHIGSRVSPQYAAAELLPHGV
jgi:hypothetical protein